MQGLTLYALLLLTAPEQPEVPEYLMPIMKQLVAFVGCELEVFDCRACYFCSEKPAVFVHELGIIRNDYKELLDCPHLCDIEGLPSREFSKTQCDFAFKCHYHLECQILARDKEYQVTIGHEILSDIERRQNIWDSIHNARCPYMYVSYKRKILRNLREELGEDAYYSHRYPDPVPLHIFRRFD